MVTPDQLGWYVAAAFATVFVVSWIYGFYCAIRVIWDSKNCFFPWLTPFLEPEELSPEGWIYYQRFWISEMLTLGSFIVAMVTVGLSGHA